jgi:hypothetical protein
MKRYNRVVITSLLVSFAAVGVQAQFTPTYWTDWSEIFTSPPAVVRHYSQPVSLYPDTTGLTRTSGLGMSSLHINASIYSISQAKSAKAGDPYAYPYDPDANYGGDMGPWYSTNPGYVGDHVDMLLRRDVDGVYDAAKDFFALPRNNQLYTLADATVKQASVDALRVLCGKRPHKV